MKLTTNASAQSILVGAVAYIGNADEIDPQIRFWATLGCCLLMLGLSVLAQYFNPNGTSAKASWEPRRKP